MILNSVDFAVIEKLQHEGNWVAAGELLAEAGRSLQAAGANFLVICTNTMHKVSPQITESVNLPLVHTVDPTAHSIAAAGYSAIGLLGTGFTMEDDFYRGRMESTHNINVLVPDAEQRADVHRIIYEELCRGVVSDESRKQYLAIIDSLHELGAEGVILGCTEITMLVKQDHTAVPLFDTTALHADAVVQQIVS